MGTIIGLLLALMGWSIYTDFRPIIFIVIGAMLVLKISENMRK